MPEIQIHPPNPHSSQMISHIRLDFGGGWVISIYWTGPRWSTPDPLHCFWRRRHFEFCRLSKDNNGGEVGYGGDIQQIDRWEVEMSKGARWDSWLWIGSGGWDDDERRQTQKSFPWCGVKIVVNWFFFIGWRKTKEVLVCFFGGRWKASWVSVFVHLGWICWMWDGGGGGQFAFFLLSTDQRRLKPRWFSKLGRFVILLPLFAPASPLHHR